MITCGTKSIPSFANQNHIDKEDKNSELEDQCRLRINREEDVVIGSTKELKRHSYANRLLDTVGAGVHTTCGYYLCLDDMINGGNGGRVSHNDYFGYFLMSGLGCCVRLRHKHYHQFHAYDFDHNTAVPYVIMNGLVTFKDTHVNMFAWGEENEETDRRRSIAIDLGIIIPAQYVTNRRVTEFFAANANHPLRHVFGLA